MHDTDTSPEELIFMLHAMAMTFGNQNLVTCECLCVSVCVHVTCVRESVCVNTSLFNTSGKRHKEMKATIMHQLLINNSESKEINKRKD